MKECYKINEVIKVCGTLDLDINDNKIVIINDSKDEPPTIIDFEELLKRLLGKKISLSCENEISVQDLQVGDTKW